MASITLESELASLRPLSFRQSKHSFRERLEQWFQRRNALFLMRSSRIAKVYWGIRESVALMFSCLLPRHDRRLGEFSSCANWLIRLRWWCAEEKGPIKASFEGTNDPIILEPNLTVKVKNGESKCSMGHAAVLITLVGLNGTTFQWSLTTLNESVHASLYEAIYLTFGLGFASMPLVIIVITKLTDPIKSRPSTRLHSQLYFPLARLPPRSAYLRGPFVNVQDCREAHPARSEGDSGSCWAQGSAISWVSRVFG
jgi:hypothetical protein